MSDLTDLTRAFTPLDPDFVRDPYSIYAALREREPVHRSHMGFWVLTRHEDVIAAMRDERLSNRPSPFAVVHGRNKGKYVAAQVAGNILPFLDPPEHTAPRRLITRAFFAQIQKQPPDVRGIARRLLDGRSGELDLLADFATPLSVSVIAQLLGLPPEDEARLEEWSNWFFYLFSAIPSQEVLDGMNRGLAEFRAYMLEQVEARRRDPRGDLVSRLVEMREDETQLSDEELAGTCMLLFADGVENVDSGIGNMMLALLQRPELLAAVREDPALIPAAVEEALRFDAPGQFIAKIARENLELGGQSIRKHHAVLLVLASANRDSAAFEDPDAFRLDRASGQHLAFGKGKHSCIGAPLVKLEMEGALEVLLETFATLELVDPEPVWEARLGHRWLARLLVRTG